jgi:hypothetical protein
MGSIKLPYGPVVVFAVAGIAALIGCSSPAPAPASKSSSKTSTKNTDTDPTDPPSAATPSGGSTPAPAASTTPAASGANACDAAFNKCAAANPNAVKADSCFRACKCDPNQQDCPCMDQCAAQCDQACQQTLDSCDQAAGQDAACVAQQKQCDSQFVACLSPASPAAAQVYQCATACNCDPSQPECPCADNCYAQCDAACGKAMDACGQKQTGVCALPSGG